MCVDPEACEQHCALDGDDLIVRHVSNLVVMVTVMVMGMGMMVVTVVIMMMVVVVMAASVVMIWCKRTVRNKNMMEFVSKSTHPLSISTKFYQKQIMHIIKKCMAHNVDKSKICKCTRPTRHVTFITTAQKECYNNVRTVQRQCNNIATTV
jgi:ABC-type uncharacterized transport system permease subunit